MCVCACACVRVCMRVRACVCVRVRARAFTCVCIFVINRIHSSYIHTKLTEFLHILPSAITDALLSFTFNSEITT